MENINDSSENIPDYHLLKIIGGGSYGEVWLARSVTGVFRAIKIVNRNRFPDPRPFLREFEGVKRFQKEVGGQPRQLALLHVGRNEQTGILYYVMELADDATSGTEIDPSSYVPLTLKETKRRKGLLPPEECARIGAELAEALCGLHNAGLVHRDIKPSNIIFVAGVTKLADIGLIGSTEQSLTSLGTPGYAPPEGGGTMRADLFSLGIMLYELATGFSPQEFPRLPVNGMTKKDSRPLLELNEIILKACDADPKNRYATAQKMLDELRLVIAGQSVRELNRSRIRLRRFARVGLVAGMIGTVLVTVLAINNYMALHALAKQETESRIQIAYTSDLRLAAAALSRGDLGMARAALRRDEPKAGAADIRGLEWHLFWNESNGSPSLKLGVIGGAPVTMVALSSDNGMLAAIERGQPNTSVTWNVQSKERKFISNDCYSLAGFLADNRQIVVGGYDGSFRVLNLTDSTQNRPLKLKGRFLEEMVDGVHVLVAGQATDDDRIYVWNALTDTISHVWEPSKAFPVGTLSGATRSSKGAKIAASMLWSKGAIVKVGVIIHDVSLQAKDIVLPEYSQIVRMCFSDDERHLALGTENSIIIVDTKTGEKEQAFPGKGQQFAMRFSPDGKLLAVAGEDQLISIWNLADQTKREYSGHESAILALAWTKDSKAIVTGGLDGTVRVWNINEVSRLSHINTLWTGVFGDITLSPNGDHVAGTIASDAVSLFESDNLASSQVIHKVFQPLAYLDGGARLALLSEQRQLVVLDVKNGTLDNSEVKLPEKSVLQAFGISQNKCFSIFGFADGSTVCWDLIKGKEISKVSLSTAQVCAVAIANDGLSIAVSDWEGGLSLGSTQGRADPQKLVSRGDLVRCLSFSPNGATLATGSERGELVIWEVARAKIQSSAFGHSGTIYSVIYSPRGERVITGGADGQVVSWSTNRLHPTVAWTAGAGGSYNEGIYRLDINANGDRLASMTIQGGLRIWDCSPKN